MYQVNLKLLFPVKRLSLRLLSASSNTSNTIQQNDTTGSLKSFNSIPGPKSLPVIGTLYKYLPFIGDYNSETLDENAWLNWRKYGALVREYPGTRLLNIYDPDDIESVFRQDDRYPSRRSHVAMLHYRQKKSNVYNTGGLLSTNGPDWWKLRSSFQKNFTAPQSVKGHISSTDKIVKEFIEWIKNCNVNDDDFLPYLNRLNLEIIGMVALNVRFNSFTKDEQEPDSRSSRTIEAAFGSNSGIYKLDKGILWRYFSTPLYKKLVASQDYLEKVAKDILVEKMNFFEGKEDLTDNSLLKSFINQPNVDVKDILGMLVDILMASIDTTAYSTSFALYHLARNPDCQQKVYCEIKKLLPDKKSDLSPEIITNAVYVRSAIKESLRLNPVSIGVGRWLQKDIILKGYLIPKGTVIVTQNMVASRLPQYVRDPLKFKPDRWIRDSPEYENIHPFLSLPFGFGPRSCIARRLAEQNICISLIRILREFEIKWNGEELGVQTLLINKPDNAIALSFSQRSS